MTTDIDQKAMEIAGRHVRVDYDPIGTGIVAEIAAALQSARNDALEEAAKIAHAHRDNGRDDFAAGSDVTAERIEAAIRALRGE